MCVTIQAHNTAEKGFMLFNYKKNLPSCTLKVLTDFPWIYTLLEKFHFPSINSSDQVYNLIGPIVTNKLFDTL